MTNFQLSPEEPELPFAQIPNDLLRDPSISPEVKWFIAFLLSHSGNWKISIPQIMKSQNISKDRMYWIVNKTLETGYIKREKRVVNGLRRFMYFVSRTPRFEKCLPCPENPDLGNQDAKEYQSKEHQSLESSPYSSIISKSSPISPKGDCQGAPKKIIEKKPKPEKIEKAPFVKVTQVQHDKLVEKEGEIFAQQAYLELSEWKIRKHVGDRPNDMLAIYKWALETAKEKILRPINHWEINHKLIMDLRKQFPERTKGLEFYYISKTLKHKGYDFDLSGEMPPDSFERKVLEHLKIDKRD